jgi:glycerophosphoryl diester phosphodiesterase
MRRKTGLLQYLTGKFPHAVIRKLKKYNIDGGNVGDSRSLTREYIEKITSAGFPVHTWTVNDPNRALTLPKSGVACITTDKAAWMAEVHKNNF